MAEWRGFCGSGGAQRNTLMPCLFGVRQEWQLRLELGNNFACGIEPRLHMQITGNHARGTTHSLAGERRRFFFVVVVTLCAV